MDKESSFPESYMHLTVDHFLFVMKNKIDPCMSD